jgi:hypothetical protein
MMRNKHTLHNRIHWTALLAKTAVDALCHVNVISRCPPASIFSLFGFNCDGLSRADSFAQLASNASFLARGISSQCVLASEARRDWTLFKRVEYCVSVVIDLVGCTPVSGLEL